MAESHAAGGPEPASEPGSAGAPDVRAPVVTAPVLHAGPSKKVERSGSRLGRSALFVHGLGMAFALVAGAVLYFGAWDFHGEDPFVLMAVGGGALIACTLWSMILAVRAVRNRERLLLPAILGLLVWAEASAILLPLWLSGVFRLREVKHWPVVKAVVDVVFDLALPVLLPVLLCTVLLALLPGWLIVRRIEARRSARGAEAWTPAQRGRVKRCALAACFALLTFLSLPIPLVLYCAAVSSYEGSVDQSRYVYWGYVSPSSRGRGKDWMAELVCRAPSFLTHLADRAASELPGREMAAARGGFVRFLALSEEQLEAIAGDFADPLAASAFIALQQSNPERAAALVRRMWKDPVGIASGQALNCLIMLNPETAELLFDDLVDLCFTGPSQRVQEAAFRILANSAPRDKLRKIIERWTRSSVPTDRILFYSRLCWSIGDVDLFMETVIPGLDENDPVAVCAVLNVLSWRLTRDSKPAVLRKVIARCVMMQENAHPAVRQAALQLIVRTTVVELSRKENDLFFNTPNISPASPPPPGWQPPPIYEKVRAAAEQWLKEHGE